VGEKKQSLGGVRNIMKRKASKNKLNLLITMFGLFEIVLYHNFLFENI
jgi:hypothetical protein